MVLGGSVSNAGGSVLRYRPDWRAVPSFCPSLLDPTLSRQPRLPSLSHGPCTGSRLPNETGGKAHPPKTKDPQATSTSTSLSHSRAFPKFPQASSLPRHAAVLLRVPTLPALSKLKTQAHWRHSLDSGPAWHWVEPYRECAWACQDTSSVKFLHSRRAHELRAAVRVCHSGRVFRGGRGHRRPAASSGVPRVTLSR